MKRQGEGHSREGHRQYRGVASDINHLNLGRLLVCNLNLPPVGQTTKPCYCVESHTHSEKQKCLSNV